MIERLKIIISKTKATLLGDQKSAAGDFFWYILPMGISFILGLVTLPIITKNISVAAYGQYDYLIIVVGFLGMFFSLGLSSALQEALYKGDIAEFSHHTIAKSIYYFWFLISGVGLAIGCLAYYFLQGYQFVFLFFIYFSVFSSLMQNVPKEYLRKDRRPQLLAGVEVFSNVFKAGGIAILFFLSIISLNTILIVGGLFAIIRLVVFWYLYLDYNEGRFSWMAIWESLKIGIPAMPASISNYTIQASDRFFIKGFQGNEPLGLYAMNMKFDNYMSLMVIVIHNTFYPIFGNKLSENLDVPSIEQKIIRLLALFSVFLFIGAIFMKEFILLVSRPEFYAGSWIFLIIANYIFLYLWQHLYQAHIVTSGRVKLIGLLRGSGAIVNLLLNYFLVQYYSYMGAALSTLAAHSVSVFLIYFLLRNDFNIQWKKHALILILLNFFILLNIFFITIPEPALSWSRIGIKAALSLFLGIIVILYTKPVKWNKINN